MTNSPADLLLREYLNCADKDREQSLLEQLVTGYAEPSVRKIVRYKFSFQSASESQDWEDVVGDVLVELIQRLHAMKYGADSHMIQDFASYAAVAAYHACNEYLRRKYPARHRLKIRLRYMLTNDEKLGLWEHQGEWVCGLRVWMTAVRSPVRPETILRSGDLFADLPRGPTLAPAQMLRRVLERIGGPVELDDLVGIAAEIWGVQDPKPVTEAQAKAIESPTRHPGAEMEQRQWLARLWSEIAQLPLGQRHALLLNLRGGGGLPALALFPLTAVASMSQIAQVLEVTPEHLAEIWNRLPMDDLSIAERLKVTRQQVINYRKSARERLMRRLPVKSSTAGVQKTN